MRRWIAASMGALLLAAFASVPVDLQAAADKTVSGTVAAVSSDSITIKGKEAEMKLVVDSKTIANYAARTCAMAVRCT